MQFPVRLREEESEGEGGVEEHIQARDRQRKTGSSLDLKRGKQPVLQREREESESTYPTTQKRKALYEEKERKKEIRRYRSK